MNELFIETSHCRISVHDSGGDGLPVLMIHANSICKEAFSIQIDALAGKQRVVTVDLPGHGRSSNAVDARRTYSIPGYADAISEVLHTLKIERYAVLGHSLGGHVALELMSRNAERVAGAMIFGTPPVPFDLEGLQAGFLPNPEMEYTGKPDLTEEQIAMVVRLALGEHVENEDFFLDAVRRSDGLARQYMIEAAIAGQGADERALVETTTVPIVIVNGADDPVINLDYIDSLNYCSLWTNKPLRFADAGHGLHRQRPHEFNQLLENFLKTIK